MDSEFIISAILLLSFVLLLPVRKNIDTKVFILFQCHIIFMAVSGLLLTNFFSRFDRNDLWQISEILLVISFFFLYKAFIEAGLSNPYMLMSQKFKSFNKRLKTKRSRRLHEKRQQKMIEDMNAVNRQFLKLRNDIIKNEMELFETREEYKKSVTEFFSNISHEFRTPLNVILSAIQVLSLQNEADEGDSYNYRLTKYNKVIKQNCYRLLRLVNNLIDLGKYDAGDLKLNLSNKNIVSIVEETVMSVADFVKKQGLTIVFDTDVEEKIIAVDTDSIERVILNLLSNAIKFTDKGVQ